MDGYTVDVDHALYTIAAHVRAGRLERAALAMEAEAARTRCPGLRALLTDCAAKLVEPAAAKRNGEA